MLNNDNLNENFSIHLANIQILFDLQKHDCLFHLLCKMNCVVCQKKRCNDM